MRYRWFLAASALGYTALALWIPSERSQTELISFLAILGILGGLWWAAIYRARRWPPSLAFLLLSGLLFRALMLPAGFDFERGEYRRLLLYDDDVWRYLWEGHAWLAGADPMRTPPRDLEEYQLEIDSPARFAKLYGDERWGDVWDNIGYRQFASPYPPVAHGIFILSTWIKPASVAVFKILMVAFDLGSIYLLALLAAHLGRPPRAAAVYAWCPLPIKEFAGSGHADAAMIFLLLLALYLALRYGSGIRGGATLALALLVKPSALAAAPGLVRRFGWLSALAPATALVLLAAYPPDGLIAYARYWVFNPALPRLLPGERWLQIVLPLATVMSVSLWRYLRDDGSDLAVLRSTYWVLGAFLLTTPMLAPWYLCWILPFAALFEDSFWGSFWLLLSISIFLSYYSHLAMTESLVLWGLQFLLPLAGSALWHRRFRPIWNQPSSS